MNITNLYTVKGGQGCTVAAALLGMTHSKIGRTLLIDNALHHDLQSVLGVPVVDGTITEISDDLDLAVEVDPGEIERNLYDHIIVDWGTHDDPPVIDATSWHLVTQSCYLALRRATRYHAPSSIVHVVDHSRALRAGDIEATLGARISVTIPIDSTIARCVDAGLLTARSSDSWVRIHE